LIDAAILSAGVNGNVNIGESCGDKTATEM